MTHVGIITQARMTSTRLPGKVLLQAAGRSMLDHHLDRLGVAELDVYVATTLNGSDDPIVAIARSRGLGVYRGSEHDVLARFHECADRNQLDVVVRVTSDCPLVDGSLIAEAVEFFVSEDDPWLYVSNGLERTFPRGLDFEVFSAAALAEAHANAQGAAEREHVTPYLYDNVGGRMRLHNVGWHVNKSNYRITLDTLADLEVIRSLIEDYSAHLLDCAGIISVLDGHPELVQRNAHVEQRKLDE